MKLFSALIYFIAIVFFGALFPPSLNADNAELNKKEIPTSKVIMGTAATGVAVGVILKKKKKKNGENDITGSNSSNNKSISEAENSKKSEDAPEKENKFVLESNGLSYCSMDQNPICQGQERVLLNLLAAHLSEDAGSKNSSVPEAKNEWFAKQIDEQEFCYGDLVAIRNNLGNKENRISDEVAYTSYAENIITALGPTWKPENIEVASLGTLELDGNQEITKDQKTRFLLPMIALIDTQVDKFIVSPENKYHESYISNCGRSGTAEIDINIPQELRNYDFGNNTNQIPCMGSSCGGSGDNYEYYKQEFITQDGLSSNATRQGNIELPNIDITNIIKNGNVIIDTPPSNNDIIKPKIILKKIK